MINFIIHISRAVNFHISWENCRFGYTTAYFDDMQLLHKMNWDVLIYVNPSHILTHNLLFMNMMQISEYYFNVTTIFVYYLSHSGIYPLKYLYWLNMFCLSSEFQDCFCVTWLSNSYVFHMLRKSKHVVANDSFPPIA